MYGWEKFSNTSGTPLNPGIHLIWSCEWFAYVQVPQMVSNLIFSYSGRDFILPVPALKLRDLRDVETEVTDKNWG